MNINHYVDVLVVKTLHALWRCDDVMTFQKVNSDAILFEENHFKKNDILRF